MCGLAGIKSEGAAPDRSVLEAMRERLRRRGPDGDGILADESTGLVHTRLALLDLTDAGQQPMANEDGTVHLVFNGEIYNHAELRGELEAAGHRFRSRMDGEVILHLYEEMPDRAAEVASRLRGMFAFAVWDASRRRLVIGRDRFGIKPVFLHEEATALRFASDLDALLADPAVPAELDWTSLFDFLVLRTVPGPWTLCRRVSQLPPAHVLVREADGSTRRERYWTPPLPDPEAGAADLETLLQDAVSSHLQADVPVGAFLSAGIDSGLVTALARRLTEGEFRTYSLSFPGEEIDEGPEAKATALRLGTSHREVSVEGGLLDGAADAVAAMDQPMALESALSLHRLARRSSEEVKVVLSGDGGDELFLGYRRHNPYPVPVRHLRLVPEGLRPFLGAVTGAVLPRWVRERSEWGRKAEVVASRLRRTESEKYVPRLRVLPPQVAMALIPEDARGEVDTLRYLRRVQELFESCEAQDPLDRMTWVDVQTSLSDEMLAKADRMTMAVGLESRVPLLDGPFADAALRLPATRKRVDRNGKLPLRDLARKHLGEAVALRPKSGFSAPSRKWIEEDEGTRRSVLEGLEAAAGSPWLDGDAVRRLAEPGDGDEAMAATSMFVVGILGAWLQGGTRISA